MTTRFSMVVATHLFLLKDDQILLTRRFQTGWEDGNYSLPAGHVEVGETAREALVREAREEIGLSLQVTDLTPAHVMHRLSDRERVDFFFVCARWTGEPFNAEPNKCDDVQWFSLNALPKNTVLYIRQALVEYQRGNFYSECGW